MPEQRHSLAMTVFSEMPTHFMAFHISESLEEVLAVGEKTHSP
jgi:hypothetical protein